MITLRACAPVNAGHVIVVVVERVWQHHAARRWGFTVVVSKTPVGVVFRSGSRLWALDLNGREIDLEEYLREVNGLVEALRDG